MARIATIGRFLVDPRVLLGICALGAAASLAVENSTVGLAFLASVFLLIACGLWFATRRPGLGLLGAWFLLFVSAAASMVKYKFMAVKVHVADIDFHLRDADLVAFLVTQMPSLLIGALAVTLIGAVLFAMVARAEPVTGARRGAFVAMTAAAFLVWANHPPLAMTSEYYTSKRLFASSFFASLALTPALFAEDELKQRLLAEGGREAVALPATDACEVGARPDIVLVLAESAFPPSLYPQIKAPASLSDSFRSDDGKIHPLRAEMFGAGTATSMVAALGGLPASEFGWRAPYLTSHLKGRIGMSLPQRLKQCGYETAVVSPLPFGFVDEGPFMTSIGIDDYKDYGRMRWKTKQERDHVYYGAALKHLEARRAAGGKPQFVFVLTMTGHSPYNFRFDPETKVPGEPFGNGGEMDEFLRRLTLARSDFELFRRDLFGLGGRPMMLVEFGDHQPLVTADLMRARDAAEKREGRESIGFQTFYAVHAFGMKPVRPPPAVEALDIGFLGASLLEMAGVPTGPIFADLLALRDKCGGRFAGCPDQAGKDRYLARLLRSGALRL